ncbi:CDP-alcohol phosphatidyltransferase family protein [Cochlodiniinecator piscidefendens]|uniref:CDP-alcohol phosphatidyltransferase family protein n=1 Tax=Cochlodiniinecator piscidefendens TaxID=2715756 RepID=UPI001407E8FD|nr:phosphatidylcholine/phosphatidylserine synthase [Cochlodiniinecator piscidefendens]
MTTGKRVPLRCYIPNLITLFGLCLGLASVRLAMLGQIEAAIMLLLFASLADAADGKAARFLKSASPFGAALDTLSDFFNFGVVPIILLYHSLFLNSAYESFAWSALAFYCLCCVLRLARFTAADDKQKSNGSVWFTGVPAPAMCCLVLLPAILTLMGSNVATDHHVLASVYILGVGLLGVSRLRTPSIQTFSVSPIHLPFALVGIAGLLVCLTVFTWPCLVVLDIIYILSLPFIHKALSKGEKGR